MTDKEIIKALEHCAGDGYSCTGCAYDKLDYSGDYHCCDYYLKQAALGIIKRQQAEIEICAEVIERQDKEIDELNKFANERLDKFTERYDRNLKAEAIKEFADSFDDELAKLRDTYFERGFKDYSLVCEVIHDYLYRTLREMAGDEE